MFKIALINAGYVTNIISVGVLGLTLGACLVEPPALLPSAEEQEGFGELTESQQIAAVAVVDATDVLNMANHSVVVSKINADKPVEVIVDVTDSLCGIGWEYSVVDDIPVFVNPDA